MRRMMAAAVIGAASLGGVGCGGAAEPAEAAGRAGKRKIDLVVVNRSGVDLDQFGVQFAGARVSFDEVDRGETEKVTLPDGLEPRSMTLSWIAAGGRNRHSASLSAPGGVERVEITIDSSHRATLKSR